MKLNTFVHMQPIQLARDPVDLYPVSYGPFCASAWATNWEKFELENMRRVAEAIEPVIEESTMACVCHRCSMPIDCDTAMPGTSPAGESESWCQTCWEEIDIYYSDYTGHDPEGHYYEMVYSSLLEERKE